MMTLRSDIEVRYGARDLPENAGVRRAVAPGDYTASFREV